MATNTNQRSQQQTNNNNDNDDDNDISTTSSSRNNSRTYHPQLPAQGTSQRACGTRCPQHPGPVRNNRARSVTTTTTDGDNKNADGDDSKNADGDTQREWGDSTGQGAATNLQHEVDDEPHSLPQR
jgi:hypothetical protein